MVALRPCLTLQGYRVQSAFEVSSWYQVSVPLILSSAVLLYTVGSMCQAFTSLLDTLVAVGL